MENVLIFKATKGFTAHDGNHSRLIFMKNDLLQVLEQSADCNGFEFAIITGLRNSFQTYLTDGEIAEYLELYAEMESAEWTTELKNKKYF